jgi:hypothetical protein
MIQGGGAVMRQWVTGTTATWWCSGNEGAAPMAREGSLGQGGAPGPAWGGGEAVSQAALGGP